jgi:hypothetical protein
MWGRCAAVLVVLVVAPVPASVAATRYHYDLVATDAGGTSTTADSAFTTGAEPPSYALAGEIKVKGTRLSEPLECQLPTSCPGTITLYATEHLHGTRVSAVTAAVRTRRVVVGRAGVSIAGRGAASVSLNATGKQLLKRFRRLPVTVVTTATGGNTFTEKATFKR